MWICTLELVAECPEGGMFDAPATYRGDGVCRHCLNAVRPGPSPNADVPATTSFPITD
ncbi:hypothetical protein [Natrarchaeobius oligotrophus]|uniref:hypothetical protein n=1 Tax=Natrarchaeobius oligotrophus TaxID=3455743 RepID=UPI001404EC1D|nr:hypothetical protein [Natrarchaeobius chitinivorans]